MRVASSMPGWREGRVDAALEAVARIGLDAELAAGRRGAHRIEIGGFEEHIDGRRPCSPLSSRP